MSHQFIFSITGSLISLAALIALIRYTRETIRLRVEAQKQYELSLRPFIMTAPVNPFHSYSLRLINIGTSPAFNIGIDTDEECSEDFLSWMTVSSHNFLAPGEEGLWDASALRPNDKTKNKDILFEIQYSNIEGEVFFTKIKINFNREIQVFLETGKAKKPWDPFLG